MDSGITTVKVLKEFVTVIYNNAVKDTPSCHIYSKVLSDLNQKLPTLLSDQPGQKDVTVERILEDIFQDIILEAEDTKFIPDGNIPLVGELFKQKLFPEWIVHQIIDQVLEPSYIPNDHLEALCQLLWNIGMQLDGSARSKNFTNDVYFRCLKEFCTDTLLPLKLRLMICYVLDLRANNWVPFSDSDLKMKNVLSVVFDFFKECPNKNN